ncbi:MAG: hypothetical protein ACE3L7_01490 [Candidatus Pristimantibacillus sp.]
MKVLLQTIIGTLVGTALGAFISLYIFYFGIKFNLEADFRSASIALQYAKVNIMDMVEDPEMIIPKYKVLNMQLDWNEALIYYDDAEVNQTYNNLSRLDNLREIILQESNSKIRNDLSEEHRELMNEILNKKMIENSLEFIEIRS